MSINFKPQGGDVLLCNFGPDPQDPATYPLAAGPVGVPPEMIKVRHVVVIAAGQLVTVVPFSTKVPPHPRAFHHRIPVGSYPFFTTDCDSWLKGDLIHTVSPARLDRLYYDGRYQRARLGANDWTAIRKAVLNGIGLGQLQIHL